MAFSGVKICWDSFREGITYIGIPRLYCRWIDRHARKSCYKLKFVCCGVFSGWFFSVLQHWDHCDLGTRKFVCQKIGVKHFPNRFSILTTQSVWTGSKWSLGWTWSSWCETVRHGPYFHGLHGDFFHLWAAETNGASSPEVPFAAREHRRKMIQTRLCWWVKKGIGPRCRMLWWKEFLSRNGLNLWISLNLERSCSEVNGEIRFQILPFPGLLVLGAPCEGLNGSPKRHGFAITRSGVWRAGRT